MKKVFQFFVLAICFFCGYLIAYETFSYVGSNYSETLYYSLTDENYSAYKDYSYDQYLISVDLSLYNVDSHMFSNCGSLESVNLPNAIIVGEKAFQNCISLKDINLPNAEDVGTAAFEACYSLTSITLENVKTLNNNTFNYCENIKSIYLPSATQIGFLEFGLCSNLKIINLQSVILLNEYAFISATSLEVVYISYAANVDPSVFYSDYNETINVPFIYVEDLNGNNEADNNVEGDANKDENKTNSIEAFYAENTLMCLGVGFIIVVFVAASVILYATTRGKLVNSKETKKTKKNSKKVHTKAGAKK